MAKSVSKKMVKLKHQDDRVEITQDDESTRLSDKYRRKLRRKYRRVLVKINEKRDDLIRPDSEKFNVIVNQVDTLYKQVRRAREQVSDAKVLLGMSKALQASIRSHSDGRITPSDFVNCLLRDFGRSKRKLGRPKSVSWRRIGRAFSHVFMKAPGCHTMNGPLEIRIKGKTINRVYVRQPKLSVTLPCQFDESRVKEKTKTDTDKNMAKMFQILRRKRRKNVDVVLESLVFNRFSFAQTVENLFALSFLVKDGRAEITVNEHGSHIVSPKNAPRAASVASGQVNYSHFVFRFDFKDWQGMKDVVPVGEELMPNRTFPDTIDDIKPKIVTVAQECPDRDSDAAMELLPLVSVVRETSH